MLKPLIAAAAVALASATAMAQNDTTQNNTTKTNPPAMATNPPSMTTTPAEKRALMMPAGTPNFITVHSGEMLSSNVVGLDVYNDQNNDIGKIQYIAFDSSKKMTGCIVSVGGILRAPALIPVLVSLMPTHEGDSRIGRNLLRPGEQEEVRHGFSDRCSGWL